MVYSAHIYVKPKPSFHVIHINARYFFNADMRYNIL